MNADLLISPAAVRAIAADWHGGQWTPLYALCSTGAIPNVGALCAEIEACEAIAVAELHAIDPRDAAAKRARRIDVAKLRQLALWAEWTGERESVPGWAAI